MNAEDKVYKILRRYDMHDDPELFELALEIFKCGMKEGMRQAEGFGMREEDDDEEEMFRERWMEGGYGERGSSGGGYSGGSGGSSGSSGGYGMRRGVRGTGPYAGEYRRRRR